MLDTKVCNIAARKELNFHVRRNGDLVFMSKKLESDLNYRRTTSPLLIIFSFPRYMRLRIDVQNRQMLK